VSYRPQLCPSPCCRKHHKSFPTMKHALQGICQRLLSSTRFWAVSLVCSRPNRKSTIRSYFGVLQELPCSTLCSRYRWLCTGRTVTAVSPEDVPQRMDCLTISRGPGVVSIPRSAERRGGSGNWTSWICRSPAPCPYRNRQHLLIIALTATVILT